MRVAVLHDPGAPAMDEGASKPSCMAATPRCKKMQTKYIRPRHNIIQASDQAPFHKRIPTLFMLLSSLLSFLPIVLCPEFRHHMLQYYVSDMACVC